MRCAARTRSEWSEIDMRHATPPQPPHTHTHENAPSTASLNEIWIAPRRRDQPQRWLNAMRAMTEYVTWGCTPTQVPSSRQRAWRTAPHKLGWLIERKRAHALAAVRMRRQAHGGRVDRPRIADDTGQSRRGRRTCTEMRRVAAENKFWWGPAAADVLHNNGAGGWPTTASSRPLSAAASQLRRARSARI